VLAKAVEAGGAVTLAGFERAHGTAGFQVESLRQLDAALAHGGAGDVIARGRGGYELAATIEAESEVSVAEASTRREATPEERQQWFITQAEESKKPSKALYMKQFDQSESTWKRDLKGITPFLEMVGTGAGAYYRSKKKRLLGVPFAVEK